MCGATDCIHCYPGADKPPVCSKCGDVVGPLDEDLVMNNKLFCPGCAESCKNDAIYQALGWIELIKKTKPDGGSAAEDCIMYAIQNWHDSVESNLIGPWYKDWEAWRKHLFDTLQTNLERFEQYRELFRATFQGKWVEITRGDSSDVTGIVSGIDPDDGCISYFVPDVDCKQHIQSINVFDKETKIRLFPKRPQEPNERAVYG